MSSALQSSFITFDGSSLIYRAWLPAGPIRRGIVLFHRGHEHGGRMEGLVERLRPLQPAGTAFFAWDQRGHGQSPGERGWARHISDIVRDVECFVRFLTAEYQLPEEELAIVAHSVAAVVVGQWALDYAPRVRALVLAAPALRVKLYVPLALPGLQVLQTLSEKTGRPQPYVRSYVTGRWLTHDLQEVRRYDEDPLISKKIAVNILLGLRTAARRLIRRAGDLEIPTLILSARADWVVKNRPMRRLFRQLPSPLKSVRVYKDAYHALFHDRVADQVAQDVHQFIHDCFDQPVDRQQLLQADRRGASFERYEWHKAGLPWLNPRRWAYKAMKLAMKTLGRLSKGIRLGIKSGYSSGQTLAYVYGNKAQGLTPLGKAFDRVYLDSPGWINIRTRRVNLQLLVREALRRLGPLERIHLFDLAGGPGHYLMDLASELPQLAVRVRDRNGAALAEGRQRAGQLGLAARVEFEEGDAFDSVSLAQLGPFWQIGIISGLLELFPSNQPAEAALAGAAQAIVPGGYLIYTNQPWHPQLELISETLTHGDGSPWTMRCRSQAEMDELVRAAGFDKLAMLQDDDAVFTVSLAKRRS